ncbi:MAG: hypothetical protein AAFQ64_15010 [Pseudomonadota bacterium]
MRTKRRGSLSLESGMIVPVAVAMILMGRFILEASLARQEVSVYTRMGTHTAAAVKSTNASACISDVSAFTGRTEITQTATISCDRRDAERGLSAERPFWDAVERGAAPWRAILADVKPNGPVYDITGEGSGTTDVGGTDFLEAQDTVTSDYTFIAAQDIRWDHDEQPMARGHDQAIWKELRKRGTYRLFPNVFPSR